ncbi:MAG TPA: mannitol dehydrogenase family protein, partial [Woeseiaceae bacterium]|nr:mannitol dehydrogenase family protein [Woeseiaceae bacterium]
MAPRAAELTAPRLGPDTLAALAPAVVRPAYERSAAGVGIVHLGVGAFMRAHVAVYCDETLGSAGGDWAIAGVSLRRPNVYEQLAPQDCLYMVCVRSGKAADYRLIGAIRKILVAPDDPAAVIRLLAQPATRIVTITVTEKGYCLDARRTGLDKDHPDIARDLAHPEAPRSLVGILHAACRARQETDAGPLTIVSCDNLPANGRLLERALADFSALSGTGADWICANAAFPSTMVDRIVPATTTDDVTAAAAATGVEDHGLVCTEPFTQWVIEDRFAGERPAWEQAGALLVEDVRPYETAKLRLLNGAHSTIAYLGYLAGHAFVHEVMADAVLARFVERMMVDEISPVTPAPEGMAHDDYIPALLERFANPALRHRTWQIAMDGSEKLPQRLVESLRLQRARGGSVRALALAVAAWMRYVTGVDDAGRKIEVSDPRAREFAAIAADCRGDAAAIVDRLLAVDAIFGDDLPYDTALRTLLTGHLRSLSERGARDTVAGLREDS